MNVEIDPKMLEALERLAASRGEALEQVVEAALREGVETLSKRDFAFDPVNWKLDRFLDEVQALPESAPDDGFSGADHDDVLYPRRQC